MDSLLAKLKEWISFINKSIIGIIVIQAIFLIIIGIASNKFTGFNDIWTVILIVCSVFYIFFVFVQTAYQLKFPGSIVEELDAKNKLIAKEQLLERQNTINKYFAESIQYLNEQTCSIDNFDNKTILCDKDLVNRLNQLLKTLVINTDVIIDTSRYKDYTIGLYLEEYYKKPDNIDDIVLVEENEFTYLKDYKPIQDQGILVLKDNLNIKDNLLPKKLIELPYAINAEFEIQTSIKRCLNNHCFDKHEFNYKNETYTIICSDIPDVCCNDRIIGVLFIISKKINEFPSDISDILKIYNRLISNYKSKYDQCIVNYVIIKKNELH